MDIKKVLKENNFIFEKKFGQNFLTDLNLLGSIVENSNVDKNSTVVEIGVGAGTLTGEIAKRVKKVYGFEIDTKLQPILSKTLQDYSNVELIFKDVLKVGVKELENIVGSNYTVIANLPYYITTPIIMAFIEESCNCDAVVVTVQKEVAERIVAKNSTSDYGAITASINATCDSEIIKYVGREMFYPAPNVDSAVVKITFNKNKYQILDIKEYRNLVKNAFCMRRKTLVNNLLKGYNLDRQTVETILNSCGFDLSVRGEALSSFDFVNLCNYMIKNGYIK